MRAGESSGMLIRPCNMLIEQAAVGLYLTIQREQEIAMQIGRPRPGLECGAETIDGFVEPALRFEDIAEVIEDFNAIGIEPEGGLVLLGSVSGMIDVRQQIALIVAGKDVVRIEREDAFELGRRLGHAHRAV